MFLGPQVREGAVQASLDLLVARPGRRLASQTLLTSCTCRWRPRCGSRGDLRWPATKPVPPPQRSWATARETAPRTSTHHDDGGAPPLAMVCSAIRATSQEKRPASQRARARTGLYEDDNGHPTALKATVPITFRVEPELGSWPPGPV